MKERPKNRWSQRFFGLLSSFSAGCGKLPLLAALLLLGAWRYQASHPVEADPVPSALEAVPADFGLIDAVLAKRAPELGMTLRRQLGFAIAEEARRSGYDPLLILALIDVESDFEEEAISNKGARGLMQIKPSTLYFLARKQGLQLTQNEVASDPALCVRLGIRYLRELQDKMGDLDLALMAYNAGPAKIRQVRKSASGLEPYRRYPGLVRRDFRHFREGLGLGGDWALAERTVTPHPVP
jgi:soluble lytic murein transglycosylase-like protein